MVFERIEGGTLEESFTDRYLAFNDCVKDTFLFPGSLYELNENHPQNRKYKLLRTNNSQQYVSGIIIPLPEEIAGVAAAKEAILSGLGDEFRQVFHELYEEASHEQLFSNESLLSQDIRFKAKQLGADGIVRVQLYSTEPVVRHWGLPIVCVNADRR